MITQTKVSLIIGEYYDKLIERKKVSPEDYKEELSEEEYKDFLSAIYLVDGLWGFWL